MIKVEFFQRTDNIKYGQCQYQTKLVIVWVQETVYKWEARTVISSFQSLKMRVFHTGVCDKFENDVGNVVLSVTSLIVGSWRFYRTNISLILKDIGFWRQNGKVHQNQSLKNSIHYQYVDLASSVDVVRWKHYSLLLSSELTRFGKHWNRTDFWESLSVYERTNFLDQKSPS